MKKIIWMFALLLFIPFAHKAAAANELQQLIDSAEAGSEIQLEAKQYDGPVSITKPLTITGVKGTKIVSKTTGFTLENSEQLSLKELEFETVESPLILTNVKEANLSNLRFSIENKGPIAKNVTDLHIKDVSITGKKQGHFYYKPHGFEIYNSQNIRVTDVTIENTQDGIYFEQIEDVHVTKVNSSNARYGLHFMYAKNILIDNNKVHNNTTGLMLMIVENVEVTNNTILRQLALNSIGLYIYDVKNAVIHNNEFLENTVATVWHNVTDTKFEQNLFQANSTVVQATKSPEVVLRDNVMIGNILVARSDKVGFQLIQNEYDDYSGYDFDQNDIGDTPYETYTSFGQWMVRKPVYQYFIESPSVVLLNKMDASSQTTDQTILTDDEPVMPKTNSDAFKWNPQWLEMFIGLLGIFGMWFGWRKLR